MNKLQKFMVERAFSGLGYEIISVSGKHIWVRSTSTYFHYILNENNKIELCEEDLDESDVKFAKLCSLNGGRK
jgi:hypothetical protein